LSADLFGDWREEIIWRTADNLNLRIYTTTTPATNRFYTLMHDPQYRCAIAWQNTGYNQPPHPGFYLGPDMFPPPLAPISSADLVWRGNASSTWDAASANWFTNGIWVSNNAAIAFAAGKSVLFDLSGSNNSPVTISGTLAPSQVTVHSAKDFIFSGGGQLSGAMKLVKAGEGKLTLNNTNTHTGATIVSGGSLFVNGTLTASPVTVERRGTPEGASQFGGSGRLGAGLTVQAGCKFIVGSGTNSTGTLMVTNGVTLLGSTNQFDLSNLANGTTNDKVIITGNLTLGGTNLIEITQLNGALGAGVYPLFTYSGTLSGGLSNLILSGNFIQSVVLTNPPGIIGLLATVPSSPPNPPTNLVAVALNSVQINLTWADAATTENNFLIERSTNNVNFALLDTLTANVTTYADFGLTPNTTYYYRVRAANLAGVSTNSNVASATTTSTPIALTWRGDGAANVWDITTTSNWLNGASRTVYADTAFVTFNDAGSNSPNINLTAAFAPGALTFSNNTKNYTLSGAGSLYGAMAFYKNGSGVVTLATTNTFTGGIFISNGAVALSGSTFNTSYTANSWALGAGPVNFRGGALRMFGYSQADNTSSYGPLTNDLIIPTGQFGTLAEPPRGIVSSKVTGGGTLTLSVDYVRGDVQGDWTGFTGQLNVVQNTSTAASSTTDDFRIKTTTGFPNAKMNLATNVILYAQSSGLTIPIGEFSGNQGAVVAANGGSGASTQYAVTIREGKLNTDCTNAALFQGSVTLIKEGSGKWTLTRDNTYSGSTTVSNGWLLINGNQSAATGALLVKSAATLGGAGVIGGVTTIEGVLSPGNNSLAALMFAANLIFATNGVAALGISRNPIANDFVVVNGTLTLNGALNVVNTSPEILADGDAFQLFSAASITGNFTNLTLPALDAGLAWNTTALNSSGVISVVAITTPVIGEFALDGNNLVITGHSGVPGLDYYLLGSSNLNFPVAAWSVLKTNQFDAGGNFSLTNALNPNWPQGFYRLQIP
jgi:fibronectin-binding autotransporter adhesin